MERPLFSFRKGRGQTDGRTARASRPAAHERPRERMLAVGAEQLSVAELLAILLRTGHRDESVLALAQRLLKQFGSLRELAAPAWRS